MVVFYANFPSSLPYVIDIAYVIGVGSVITLVFYIYIYINRGTFVVISNSFVLTQKVRLAISFVWYLSKCVSDLVIYCGMA